MLTIETNGSDGGDAPRRGLIVACVSDHPRAIALLRSARRTAQKQGIGWMVFHVENHRKPSTKENRVRLLQILTLAEEMGASIETIDARRPIQGMRRMISLLAERGTPAEKLIAGDEEQEDLLTRLRLRPSFARRLQKSVGCPVEVVQLEGSPPVRFNLRQWLDLDDMRIQELFYAVAAVAAATLVIEAMNYLVPEAFGSFLRNRRVTYITACAFVAGRFGVIPGLVAAVLSFFTMNFLYVEPTISSLFRTLADVVDFILFIAVALVLGLWVNRNRTSTEELEEQMNRMQALFRMYRLSMRTHTYQKTLEALHEELTTALKTEVIFFLPAPFNPERPEPAIPENVKLEQEDEAALDLAWQEAKVTGFATTYHNTSPYRFKPLITASTIIGVMAIRMDRKTVADEAYSRLLSAITDSVAIILERLTMGQAMEDIRVREDREKLRSMLLSSVSHDLKTPLASVIGSLSVYRSMSAKLPEDQRVTLIQTALDEAQRLDSFITNILDMTRLESGQIRFKQDWVRPSDMLRSVEKRLRERLHHHKLVVHRPEVDDKEVCIDIMMTEQVIQNVLDNAAKYTPPGTRIDVNWEAGSDNLFRFFIRDNGPGIPKEQIEKIFDKYARIKRQDSQVAGTGLGLAIARSVMQAQGGGISAANSPEGGAVFTIALPKWRNLADPQNQQRVA